MTGPDGYPIDCPTVDAWTYVPVSAATTRADAICALAHNIDALAYFGVGVFVLVIFAAVAWLVRGHS